MFEKLGQKGKTYEEGCEDLRKTMEKAVPAELLEKFDQNARELGEIDFLSRSLKPGGKAPTFTLPNALLKDVSLTDLLEDGPVVVTFYRGEWCPYCNLQLHHYQQYLPEITSLGAKLIAISPQTPDHSLSMKEKNELEFDVLSDAGNKVADAYGLVFEMQENVKPLYAAAGSVLPQFNGDDSWTLPAAGTFIIGQDLTVEYAFVGGDYTKRLESETILNELREIQLRGQGRAA